MLVRSGAGGLTWCPTSLDSQEKASDPPPGLTTADLDESAMFTMISNGSEAPQCVTLTP